MNPNRLVQLQTFLQQSPNDPFLQYAMALEYLKVGDEGQALQLFTHLRSAHPFYVGTYYHLGKLYEQLTRFDEALSTYKAGMDVAKQMGDSHSHRELQNAHQLLEDELEDY